MSAPSSPQPGPSGALAFGIVMVSLGVASVTAGIIAFALRDGMRAEIRRNPAMLFGSLDAMPRMEAELNTYQTYGSLGLGLGALLLVGAFLVVAIFGAPPASATDAQQTSSRSRIVAGVLQGCFAPLGIGRHYLGYHGLGVAQFVTCWLTLGVGVLWPFIDALLILSGRVRDKKGMPLR